jgi:hypothetical protein
MCAAEIEALNVPCSRSETCDGVERVMVPSSETV